jgi:hypothetical protein
MGRLGYWNAHSDRDWEDQCGMYDEPEPEEEEPMDDVVIDGRQSVTLKDALDLFGAFEAALDKQIYPQQEAQNYEPPDSWTYTINLTAAQWQQYSAAMALLERLCGTGVTP